MKQAARIVDGKGLEEAIPFFHRWRREYLTRTGQLPHIKLGPRRIAYDLDKIEAWLESKSREAIGE